MHIALVTPFPNEHGVITGGVAGVAYYLAEAMVALPGLEVTVIVPRWDGTETKSADWPFRVIDYRLKGMMSSIPTRIHSWLIGRHEIDRILGEIKADVAHFQGSCALAEGCSIPNVVTVHGVAERDELFKADGIGKLLRWVSIMLTEVRSRKRIRNIIAISEYTRNLVTAGGGDHQTWLIQNPIAESFFQCEWRPERGRVLCCSRVSKLKNTLGSIEAMALVLESCPEARLRLAGSPSQAYEAICRSRIAELGLEDKVDWLGVLSISEVQQEMSLANCLLLPSFQENAPLAISEAMAVGLPVVAAPVGGVSEMVDDGVTGILVAPDDHRDISRGICTVLEDEELAQSMSARARTIVKMRHHPREVAQKTLSVYREILSESGAASKCVQ